MRHRLSIWSRKSWRSRRREKKIAPMTVKKPRWRAIALIVSLAVAASGVLVAAVASPGSGKAKPTVVLVHGAFADSSSWNGVVARLRHDGYPVIAAANPLRGLAPDADSVG